MCRPYANISHGFSLKPHRTPWDTLISYYKWGNWGTDRLNNMFKITQLLSHRTGIRGKFVTKAHAPLESPSQVLHFAITYVTLWSKLQLYDPYFPRGNIHRFWRINLVLKVSYGPTTELGLEPKSSDSSLGAFPPQCTWPVW